MIKIMNIDMEFDNSFFQDELNTRSMIINSAAEEEHVPAIKRRIRAIKDKFGAFRA